MEISPGKLDDASLVTILPVVVVVVVLVIELDCKEDAGHLVLHTGVEVTVHVEEDISLDMFDDDDNNDDDECVVRLLVYCCI